MTNVVSVYLVDDVYFSDEDYSLLSSLPEVRPVDVDSDEFQNVVKDFYDTLQDNHNKIRIIKVRFNTLAQLSVCQCIQRGFFSVQDINSFQSKNL